MRNNSQYCSTWLYSYRHEQPKVWCYWRVVIPYAQELGVTAICAPYFSQLPVTATVTGTASNLTCT